jgi:hypothetical protein
VLSSEGGEHGGCIPPEELQESVEARLAGVAFSGKGAPRARITVKYVGEADARGWRVSVTLAELAGTIWGERSLATDGPDCRSLDDPLVLAIALMVDSELMRAQTALSETAPAAVTPAPEPDRPIPAPAVETAPGFAASRRGALKWRGAVHLGPALGLGLLPNAAWGGHVTGVVGVGVLLPLRARAELFVPQHVRLAPAGQVEFTTFTLGAGLCPTHRAVSYELGTCAGLSAAVLRARSAGLPITRRLTRTTAVVDASVIANWFFVRPWSLGAQVNLGLPLERPAYVYERPGLADQEVFRTSPLTVSVTTTAGVTF